MITTYQIRNVLRVYGNQLKKRNTIVQNDVNPAVPHAVDFVDISLEARRKQMLHQVSNDLIAQIAPKDPKHNTGVKNLANNLSSGTDNNGNTTIEIES